MYSSNIIVVVCFTRESVQLLGNYHHTLWQGLVSCNFVNLNCFSKLLNKWFHCVQAVYCYWASVVVRTVNVWSHWLTTTCHSLCAILLQHHVCVSVFSTIIWFCGWRWGIWGNRGSPSLSEEGQMKHVLYVYLNATLS